MTQIKSDKSSESVPRPMVEGIDPEFIGVIGDIRGYLVPRAPHREVIQLQFLGRDKGLRFRDRRSVGGRRWSDGGF